MKYEAVFGDQSLFDDAPSISTHATRGGGFYMVTESGGVQYLSRGPLNGDMCECLDGYLIAERRLIAEPTRWTAEDQKAGRLPEVGCIVEYFNNNEHDDTEVTAQWRNGDELEILRHQNKNKAFVVFNARTERSSDLIVQCMKPIETPEEKAARLREEWCIKALSSCSILSGMQKYELKRLGGYIEDIYDALLSGDLPAPGKE